MSHVVMLTNGSRGFVMLSFDRARARGCFTSPRFWPKFFSKLETVQGDLSAISLGLPALGEGSGKNVEIVDEPSILTLSIYERAGSFERTHIGWEVEFLSLFLNAWRGMSRSMEA